MVTFTVGAISFSLFFFFFPLGIVGPPFTNALMVPIPQLHIDISSETSQLDVSRDCSNLRWMCGELFHAPEPREWQLVVETYDPSYGGEKRERL
jgi:hypothetical protein